MSRRDILEEKIICITGKDAVRFNKEMEKAKSEVVPVAVRERMKSNYEKLLSITEK